MTGEVGEGTTLTPERIRRWGPVWSRRVGWFLAHIWWNTAVVGAANVPSHGRVLIAPNHTGAIDGALVHGAIPRGSHFLVKQEIFASRIGFLMRWSGQIPVDRSHGRAALETAAVLLAEDRVVGVFPEGTRGRGDVTSARAGVAWLAVHTGACVVPCVILGTRPPGTSPSHIPRPRARLYVEFGEPVVIAAGAGRREVAAAMLAVQQAMVALVADAQERTGLQLPD